jgi:DNA oxidative demethylase
MNRAPEGLIYRQDFLSDREQVDVLHEVRALTFEHDIFRTKTMKRAGAHFGYKYVAVGQQLEPAPPFPSYLQAVIRKAAPYHPDGIGFVQCIVTFYCEGAGIGWHRDAKRFGDCVVGVSLASEARLRFRPKGATHPSFEVTASPGSIYVMQGVARWQYEHQIMPVRTPRYSLTFRSIA